MSEVHEALKTLSATHHTEFPSDASSLSDHLATSLADIHFLLASVPPPSYIPPAITLPEPRDPAAAALQKEWKTVKLNKNDNPTGLFSVFKLPAQDGGATWFARRSVHTDIPFRRFKAGLQNEFHQPVASEKPGVGSGAIRGIGGASRILHESCELGKAEIFQLSAQFPGPSAPRDFVEGCISSSVHPEDLSASSRTSSTFESGQARSGSEPEGREDARPRHFALISKPVLDHPECDTKPGFVRGTYESVEFIREIPVGESHRLERSHSSPNISAVDGSESERHYVHTASIVTGEMDIRLQNCPVEWIQISRSNPGGSVPKWLVDRGSPGGMVHDAGKFLTWCRESTQLDDLKTLDGTVDDGNETINTSRRSNELRGPLEDTEHAERPPITKSGGIFKSTLGSVASGMANLAFHSSAAEYTPPGTCASDNETPPLTVYDAENDAESFKSFKTCDSYTEQPNIDSVDSDTHSLAASAVSVASTIGSPHSPEERALAQFLKEKHRLNEKLQKEGIRRAEQERKDMEKHLRNMDKQEKKYRRAIEKANEKRAKEQEKKEREVQKKLEKEERGLVDC